jgi:hypothetical protein
MAVLIEALTLVVPQRELDLRFPGGTEAFCQAMLELEKPPRFVCMADERLVNASFYDPPHLLPAVELLEANGFTDVEEDGGFLDFAYVDQRYGPTMPCNWLKWRQHPDGFTYAWLVGAEAGDMAAPEGWTPEQSKALTRTDLRDETGRMIRLAKEGELETWLDLETGQQGVSLARPERAEDRKEEAPRTTSRDLFSPEDEGADTEPACEIDIDAIIRELELDGKPEPVLLPIVVAALDERELHYALDEEESAVTMTFPGEGTTFHCILKVDEAQSVVRCFMRPAFWVPEPQRVRVAEAITRANYGLFAGAFEMDFSDGEIRYRQEIDVEDGTLSTTMVHNLIGPSVVLWAKYLPALMKVVYANASPEQAIREAEKPGPAS